MSTPSTLQSSLKSRDTEENIDLYFTRPIGLLWARFFQLFGTHPNVITILSIFIGAASGWFMAQGNGSWGKTLIGIALLMWANFYDSADGQLARMTGKKTRWGRILDGFAGDVWFVSVYLAVGYRLMEQPILPFWKESPLWSWWIFPVLYYVGFHLHGVQSRLADYYRNVHLYFIKGENGSELDNSSSLREEYLSLSWRDNFAWKLFLHFYINYTTAQEKETPKFQAFKRELDARYGRQLPEDLVHTFRKGSLPLMKWANAISFNWRAFTLYASLLLAVHTPWAVILYPLIESTIFHTIYTYMRMSHENLCARMHQSLSSSAA